jgi:hypothetical protein
MEENKESIYEKSPRIGRTYQGPPTEKEDLNKT